MFRSTKFSHFLMLEQIFIFLKKIVFLFEVCKIIIKFIKHSLPRKFLLISPYQSQEREKSKVRSKVKIIKIMENFLLEWKITKTIFFKRILIITSVPL